MNAVYIGAWPLAVHDSRNPGKARTYFAGSASITLGEANKMKNIITYKGR